MTIEPITFDEVKNVFRNALDKANTPTEFIQNILTISYDKGYDDAKKQWHSIEKEEREMNYKRGLDDAWNFIKRFGERTIDENKKIFGEGENYDYYDIYSIANHYEPSEAIARINEYEENKIRPNCSYLNDICPYDIECEDCEVFCSIKKGRNKVHELREGYR